MSHVSLTYHIVWRTKCSHNTIAVEHERDLYQYIFGLCKAKNCQLYRINSMPDHIHMCIEIPPMIAISEFMKVLKAETSRWMKEHHDWFPCFDAWGNGYAVFSYSVKERPNVVAYIKGQKEHHKHLSFRDEYDALLSEFGLDPKTDKFFED